MAGLLVPTQHPFFIRLKDNRLIEWSKNSKRTLKDFFAHLENGEDRALYTKINHLNLTVVGKKLKDEYVIICSNCQDPKQILQTYKQRWDIESCFKNMKSQGFNLEETHMTKLDRLMKLMAAVAVAILLTSLSGLGQKCAYKKTVKSPLYSLFTKGLRFLKSKWIRCNIYRYFIQCLKILKSEG